MLAKRGQHPGLVAILSAMEPCPTYQPWHPKETGRTHLRPDDGKCLPYNFYFIEELGLTYVRVPTWCLNLFGSGSAGLGMEGSNFFHGNILPEPVLSLFALVDSTLTSSGFFLSSTGSPKWSLTTCSSWVIRDLRVCSPASKLLRSAAPTAMAS